MKQLYIISFLLFLIGFYGCYDDEGNYDYTEVFEIRIDSMKASYTLYTLVDTLRISPEVSPADAEYDFHWGVYQTNVQGYAPTLDTIATTRYLVYPMTLDPGSYKIVCMATERNTGITEIKEVPLTVTTALSEGWYVLRTKDDCTDLDLFSTEKGKIENIIATNNEGRNLKGEARAIEFSYNYKAWDEINERYVNTNSIFALAKEEAVVIRTSNGEIIRDIDDLFYERPAVANFQNICSQSTELYLMNDGKAHYIYNMSSNSGRFGVALPGNYQLYPNWTYGFRQPLCFDKTSDSFVAINAMSSSVVNFKEKGAVDSLTYPRVSNLDADLLYIGPGPSNSGWALLKKRQTDTCLMYNLEVNNAYSPYNNPAKKCDTLIDNNSLKLLQADFRASSQNNNIIYFSQGHTVYSCNIDAGYQEKSQVILSDSENITYMRHLKYSTVINKLAVATFDGSRYKVYLYNIQAGNLQADPEILEGEGKVGALIYIKGTGKTTLY